ncbi:MAG: universal stress protein [Geminicoccaceae bacterium]|nr:universal stress protein [Geminicoccaceae bacterium]
MSDSVPAPFRVFLVVVDESQEMRNALRFACRRARHSGGRVALLHVIEPVGFQEWLGVGRRIEEEARAEAERRLQQLAGEVVRQTGHLPALHLREGDLAAELLQVLQDSPEISLLVLGTAPEGGNPGPLVSYVIANSKTFPVPVTLVPGLLTQEQIDALS